LSVRGFSDIRNPLWNPYPLGYSPQEFAQTLRALAEGKIEAESLITGRSGLEGVAAAFEELAQPDRHAKILVDPGR
jgi:threonine dehydrogenase-like Zn-dependent dehydrogenase